MAANPRRPFSEWAAENIHTLVIVCVLIGGWVANFATINVRVDTQEHRIENIERQMVPRYETEAKDKALDKRLELVQQTLDEIRAELRNQRR